MKKIDKLYGCTFSILGDSYSTFRGYIPEGYNCFYPRPEKVDDVLHVEDTWWHKLSTATNMRMLVNDSFSGSTVCTLVRDSHPKEASFVKRAHLSFYGSDGEKPDYIFVFGCTNDNWLERTFGSVQYADWTELDLEKTLPAFCYVLNTIQQMNPESQIVIVINAIIKTDLNDGMLEAGTHYGAITIELEDFDRQNGHPTALGMRQIAEQMEHALRRVL